MRLPRFCSLAFVLAIAAPPQAVAAQATSPAADSAAAAAARQLDIGEQWFRSACFSCHATGGLSNPDFRLKWGGKTAFDLFERIRSTMPETRPGSLTQGTYASIVAYLLKVNGIALGARRVSSDSTALAAIRLSFPAAASGAGSAR
jgi:S-disulfanyl-L-cysteine oxidoreductase SoxD